MVRPKSSDSVEDQRRRIDAFRIALLVACYAILFATIGALSGIRSSSAEEAAKPPLDTPQRAKFAGSKTCGLCHPAELRQWRDSHHAGAMQEATEQTVLGRFDGAKFVKDGTETTFFTRQGQFWVRTDGPDGKLDEYRIRYTFGLTPLQQYLIELPGGKLQALGIAWDVRPEKEGGQRWFDLYPTQALKPGHPLHWTGIDQNWNYQCAYCHSTDLQKNYDELTGQFNSTWAEISVGCEACHGPASEHVTWASKAGNWKSLEAANKAFVERLGERKAVSWEMLESGTARRSAPRTSAKEIEACAACHARRQQFADDSGAAGRGLHDAFRPSLLERDLYHPDGQQMEEVYNYGSFLQSRMHAAGVTCSDCHNPHSGKLRAEGNAVCGQCHAPEKFDTASHHHHPAGSKGAECASCHMPTTTYMIVDPRHDHSMRIPRPDLSYLLGTPNACNGCHTDKNSSWAADAIKAWYPNPKPGFQTFAKAFDLADRGAPGAQAALSEIANDNSGPAIARATAVARLGRFLSETSLPIIVHALGDKDPSIRLAAVGALSSIPPQLRAELLGPKLSDEALSIRAEAARSLAGEAERHLDAEVRKSFETALAEYVATQRFSAERPEQQTNLANLYLQRGQYDDARAAAKAAIVLDPTFAPAHVTLGEILRSGGDEKRAEDALRAGLERNPRSAEILHALGLSLVRQKQTAEAIDKLEAAAELAPDVARFAFVAAVALHDSGKPDDALEMLRGGLARNPYDRDLLQTLASYELEAGQLTSAVARAELLLQLEPDSPEVQALLARARNMAR